MEIIDRNFVINNTPKIIKSIMSGAIFIYPTDTIYGLGCNATDDKAVVKIRRIKKRDSNPFSIIVPNFKWIYGNCELNQKDCAEIKNKLPGPYTFFVNLKNRKAVSKFINPNENNSSIGIRIPKNWFTQIIQKGGVPFVTTSVNLSGKPHMEKVEDLDIAIGKKVDIIIYDGPLLGKPSIKIDLRK